MKVHLAGFSYWCISDAETILLLFDDLLEFLIGRAMNAMRSMFFDQMDDETFA